MKQFAFASLITILAVAFSSLMLTGVCYAEIHPQTRLGMWKKSEAFR